MIRFSGHSSSAEPIPLRTRSFASGQARSASPTIANAGHAAVDVRLDLDPPGSSPTRAWVTARASTPATATPAVNARNSQLSDR